MKQRINSSSSRALSGVTFIQDGGIIMHGAGVIVISIQDGDGC